MSVSQNTGKPVTQKQKSSKKKRPGQPTKYRPEYGQMFIDASKQGSTVEEFASSINVHKDSLSEWAKTHPEFSAAYKMARQESLVHWQKVGKAIIYGKAPNFNITVFIFWMKCVFGWKDTVMFDDIQVDLNFVD